MVACVYLPRFELLVAAGDSSEIVQQALSGKALALAPIAGARQRVGEVSGAAEAYGVASGMVLGEALARCPDLILIPPDPVKVAERWEAAMGALESIGAAVEGARPGLAYFETAGLRGIYGTDAATIAAAQHAGRSAGGSEVGGSGGGRTARVGAGPTRFCALAAVLAVRSRRPLMLEGKEAKRWLAGQPVGLLGFRKETAALLEPLHRLGVRTLGELARLGRASLADRFGTPGALAHRLACGEDSPLSPRRVQERLEESMEVGDASSGAALKRVLGVLVNRLLARQERRGRTLRAVAQAHRATGVPISTHTHARSKRGLDQQRVFREEGVDLERVVIGHSGDTDDLASADPQIDVLQLGTEWVFGAQR